MSVKETTLQPIITEKTLFLSKSSQYTFRVEVDMNKVEIAKAVEKTFKVEVAGVSVIHVRGKEKRVQRRFTAKRPDWKKAVVSLKSGRISLFEQE